MALGEVITMIRAFVECESPSDDAAAVNRFVDLLAASVQDIARVKTFSGGKQYGKHVRIEFDLPGNKRGKRKERQIKEGQILALGHSDTVWPVGTLRTMPFRKLGYQV